MGTGLPTSVRPRPVTVPLVGLLRSAETPQEPDDRWTGGLRWEPEACLGGGTWHPCGEDPGDTKDIGDSAGTLEYEPFGVWAGYRCSTLSFPKGEGDASDADWFAKGRRLLEGCESKLIAAEFWRGDKSRDAATDNRYLTHIDGTVLSGSPAEPEDAMFCLEEYLADCSCGGQAMIHATRGTVSEWTRLGLLRRVNSYILTINDTIVVSDAGYDGSGPQLDVDGAPQAPSAGIWAYATSMVEVRRSPIKRVPDSVEMARAIAMATDRTTNDIEVRAERIAAATFDLCCHGAIETTLVPCGTGS